MSLLGKLFGTESGRGSELWPPTPGKSTFVDAVPGKVVVEFFAHDNVEGVAGNFLTAVTDGLAKRRQRELVLTVRLVAGVDPTEKMRDFARFVGNVDVWAREGNLVDAGGFTQFGQRGLFGRAGSGLLYVDARPIDGVRLPARGLSAITVDANEIRAALDHGSYRVLSRLGMQTRMFPHPTWCDLERESTVTARESESLLSKVARMRAAEVTFVMTKQSLRVSLPSDTTTLLRGLRGLPPGASFALLTRPAPSANAILVWSPGQSEPTGISPAGSDGSRVSGSSLMVVPGQQNDEIRPFEDGYSVLFSTETWRQLSAALAVERSFAATMVDGLRFEIGWDDDARLR